MANFIPTASLLFSQLYIVAQDRETDVGTFFQHENNLYPPSLSDRGKLRLDKKSDLLKCLIQAPDTDTPGSLETQDLDDDTDLAACDFSMWQRRTAQLENWML